MHVAEWGKEGRMQLSASSPRRFNHVQGVFGYSLQKIDNEL